jgi:hypothetical protein
MSFHHRLSRIEKQAADLGIDDHDLPPGFDREAEEERWNAALEQVAGLLKDEQASEAVLNFLAGHFVTVVRATEPWPGDEPATVHRHRRQLPEVCRYPAALLAFFKAVPQDLRSAVAKPEAFKGTPPQRAWVSDWLWSVVRFRSRIPADLSPETMRRLVEVYIHQLDEVESGSLPVCTACGLRRPHRKCPLLSELQLRPGGVPGTPGAYLLPEFFDRCPHCGDRDMMWESRIDEKPYPWQDLAATELGTTI